MKRLNGCKWPELRRAYAVAADCRAKDGLGIGRQHVSVGLSLRINTRCRDLAVVVYAHVVEVTGVRRPKIPPGCARVDQNLARAVDRVPDPEFLFVSVGTGSRHLVSNH